MRRFIATLKAWHCVGRVCQFAVAAVGLPPELPSVPTDAEKANTTSSCCSQLPAAAKPAAVPPAAAESTVAASTHFSERQCYNAIAALVRRTDTILREVDSLKKRLSALENTAARGSGPASSSDEAARSANLAMGAVNKVLTRLQVAEASITSLTSALSSGPNAQSVAPPTVDRVGMVVDFDGIARMTTNRVRVSGIPHKVSASTVRSVMERAGPVASCIAQRVRTADGVERVMIVTFTSPVDAARALENLDGTTLGADKKIRVRAEISPETEALLLSHTEPQK